MELPLFGLAVLLGWIYVVGPLAIRLIFRMKLNPAYLDLDPRNAPPEVREHLWRAAPELGRLGFTVSGYFHQPDPLPNLVAYIALWTNRQTGQMATVVLIRSQRTGAAPKLCRYTEFLTKYADGRTVETLNSPTAGVFRKARHKDTLHVPRLRNLTELYRLHCWREDRLVPESATRYVPEPGDEAQSFKEAIHVELRRQLNTGYFYENADGNLLRPTWLGAWIITWKLLPPFRQIRRIRSAISAAWQIRESKRSANTTPTHVPITHLSPYAIEATALTFPAKLDRRPLSHLR